MAPEEVWYANYGRNSFVIAAVVSVIWVAAWQHSLNKVVWILIISLLGYGIIGFLDDGIKLYFKRNLGLRAWQKLALQIIIAIVIVWIASSDHFQFGLYIPFAGVVHSVVFIHYLHYFLACWFLKRS